MDSLRSWHGFGLRELSDAYGDPLEDYRHNLSLPEFENGSYDPDNAYRGHCNEVGCPCKYYRYDMGTGCTNIRCSMCNHTPLQHAHGRPPVPKSPIERIRSGPYPNPAFNGPVGQSFSVEYILIRFLVFMCVSHVPSLSLQISKKFVAPKSVSGIGWGANPYTSYECSVVVTCLFALPFPFLCMGYVQHHQLSSISTTLLRSLCHFALIQCLTVLELQTNQSDVRRATPTGSLESEWL